MQEFVKKMEKVKTDRRDKPKEDVTIVDAGSIDLDKPYEIEL